MCTKKILFVSYNSHQAKYFNFLKRELDKEYPTFHVDSQQGFIKGLFLPKEKQKGDLEEVINYSYQKFKVRRQKDDLLTKFYYRYLKIKARVLYNYFLNFYQSNNINLVIVWNGSSVEVATAIMAAGKLRIKKLFLENGFFPQTLVMDEKGVNAQNSLMGKDSSFYQKVQVDEKKMARLKGIRLEQRKLRNSNNKRVNVEDMDLPERFFFLPFQVHTDTQVLINSPHINNMYELVDITYSALKRFNQKYKQDYWLVVKEHPSDYGRVDYDILKERYNKEKIIFLTRTPVEDLIIASKAVITINSTVGIEALLKHKPVITLGEAFYNVEGLVYHVKDLNKLDNLLAKAIFEDVNDELIDKFLYYLRYHYLVDANKRNVDKKNIRPAVNRIKSILAKSCGTS